MWRTCRWRNQKQKRPSTPPLPKGEGEKQTSCLTCLGTAGGGVMNKNVAVIPADYAAWLAEIKTRVTAARQRAALAAECGN